MPDPSTACGVSNCLGHADERTAEVVCTRCRGRRWVLVKPASAPDPTDYTCRRCRAVLAGTNASDPLVTEAQRAAGRRLMRENRHDQPIQPANKAPIPLGDAR
jgi:DNA-directed RNA polymerase subunit RPC12/RpoP